jgi:predicted metal-dependent phosphoesterase TrpH
MRVDLHIHSTASDGRWSPPEIVERVRHTGIALFAVADHDTVASVLPTAHLAAQAGLGFLHAVEISTTLDGSLFHILGYGIDAERIALQRLLAENRERMESVDRLSIRTLIAAGYEITMQEYEDYEHDPARGGWKALSLFIDRGFCRDVTGFFQELFVGDMALEMPDFCPPERAIATIHRAGGLAVCAHPGHSARQTGLAALDALTELGLDGLECYSPYHDPAMTERLVAYARSQELLITAGSDCHGGFVNRALGQPKAHLDDLNLGPLLDRVCS